MLIALLAAAWACDPASDIQAAERALVSLDVAGATSLLEAAQADFACAPVNPDVLGRYWLLAGVRLALDGEPAELHFAAAKRAGLSAPDLTPYGEDVVATYKAAEVDPGRTVLAYATPLSNAWLTRLDGQAVGSLPIEAPAGLHLIQIVPKNNRSEASFAKILLTGDAETARIDHALPEKAPGGVAPSSVPFLGFGFGAELAGGAPNAVTTEALTAEQPGALWVVPVELSLGVTLPSTWWRLGAHVGPVLSGSYLFETKDGVEKVGFGWGVEAAGGAHLKKVNPGLAVGARLPSRIRIRAVTGIEVAKGLLVEPSFGVHLLTSGKPEPMGLLALRYQLSLK